MPGPLGVGAERGQDAFTAAGRGLARAFTAGTHRGRGRGDTAVIQVLVVGRLSSAGAAAYREVGHLTRRTLMRAAFGQRAGQHGPADGPERAGSTAPVSATSAKNRVLSKPRSSRSSMSARSSGSVRA
ncbi:MAG: hypothetical protein HKP61_10240 [Dactylosporangium sp.]|nr:hypothetical protein [Dactylosporangium sp.]